MTLEGEQATDFELESTGGGTVTPSDELEEPAAGLVNRDHWCSSCAEQLQTSGEVACDLRFNHAVSTVPIVVDLLRKVTEMRDRYDLEVAENRGSWDGHGGSHRGPGSGVTE